MKIKRRFKLLIAFAILFLVWIIAAPFLAAHLIVEKPLERADAILILGGSASFVERTHRAAELFKKGIAPRILLTDDGRKGGWNRALQRNPFFVEQAKWELIKQGVDEKAIEILPGTVASTHDEAVLLEKTARAQNLRTILLVTSGYHTRRTLWTFEKVLRDNNGSVELGIESPSAGDLAPTASYWWLHWRGWQFVGGEYLKIVYYWFYY